MRSGQSWRFRVDEEWVSEMLFIRSPLGGLWLTHGSGRSRNGFLPPSGHLRDDILLLVSMIHPFWGDPKLLFWGSRPKPHQIIFIPRLRLHKAVWGFLAPGLRIWFIKTLYLETNKVTTNFPLFPIHPMAHLLWSFRKFPFKPMAPTYIQCQCQGMCPVC